MKHNSDDHLPLRNTLERYDAVRVIRFVFNDNNKYYSQVLLHECLYKLNKQVFKIAIL